MSQPFVILTEFTSETPMAPDAFAQVTDEIKQEVKAQCPHVEWLHSYMTLGEYDVIDIVEAEDSSLGYGGS